MKNLTLTAASFLVLFSANSFADTVKSDKTAVPTSNSVQSQVLSEKKTQNHKKKMASRKHNKKNAFDKSTDKDSKSKI